jgi:2-dehydropantoate 2-reductase
MNILVYGAGVIGSVYGARLPAAGHTVTVLARGERLEEIRADGLGVEDVRTGLRTGAHVATTAALAPEDAYDAIFVTVRAD